MYADDVVLVGETKQEMEERTEEWRVALESRGLIKNSAPYKNGLITLNRGRSMDFRGS